MPPFGTRTYSLAASVSTNRAYVGTGWQAPSVSAYYKDWWEFKPTVTNTEENKIVTGALHCYPNPCSSSLTVEMLGTDLDGYNYEIYSLTGRKVSGGMMQSSKSISTSALSAGTYLLRISGNGNTYHKAFTAYSTE